MLARARRGRAPRPAGAVASPGCGSPETGDAVEKDLSAPTGAPRSTTPSRPRPTGVGTAVVGEPGVGRATLLGGGAGADPPRAGGCWSPGRRSPPTSTPGCRCGRPSWANRGTSGRRSATSTGSRSGRPPSSPAALDAEARRPAGAVADRRRRGRVPHGLAGGSDTVVEVPALRHRLADVVPLARRFARRRARARGPVPPGRRARPADLPLAGQRRRSCARSSARPAARSTFVTVRDLRRRSSPAPATS